MPEDPKQELLVALAGPAVNVVIAFMIFVLLFLTSSPIHITTLDIIEDSFLLKLMVLNIILVIFNMLPAFPMDGGRVLRALLALRMQYARSTNIASKIGKSMAVLFGLIGIYATQPFWVLIAVFVWFGANQEENMVKMKYSQDPYDYEEPPITDLQQLCPNDPIAKAVNLTLSGHKQDFAIIENGRIVGVLRIDDLMNALSNGDINLLVKDIMRTDLR